MVQELDKRSLDILRLAVEAYISTAAPVSSACVARRGKSLRASPATIRSVMADLEARGLLHQPHTSAGRIPTEKGMRVYLDSLLHPKLHPWDRTRLDALSECDNAQQFPEQLGASLAGLTGQLAVVAVPRFLGSQFREVGLVRCGRGKFVALFLSGSGLVQQKLVEVDFDLDTNELQRIQNFLNERLAHRTLEEIRQLVQTELEELAALCTTADTLTARAWTIGAQAIPPREVDLVVQGTTNLLDQPEFASVGRLRDLVRTIDDKAALLRLLDRIMAEGGVRVMLGSEHDVQEVADLACVASRLESAEVCGAAVSLVGPVRMDYGRLIPLVSYASDVFARYWQRL